MVRLALSSTDGEGTPSRVPWVPSLCDARLAASTARLLGPLLIGLGACVEPEVAVVPSTAASAMAMPDANGPFVAVGTHFMVTLVDAIDTGRSHVGQEFLARVEAPLRGVANVILVRQGAMLRGRLMSVGTREVPTLRLELDTLDTVEGPAPVQASLRHARSQQYDPTGFLGADHRDDYACAVQPAVDPFCDSYVRLVDMDRDTYADHKYGESPPTNDQPLEIRLPRGARLELVLTEPL
jgi:hypothetical protein